MGVICRLSTSDFAGDGTRIRNFRHGEAPGEERELRTLALVAREVELICTKAHKEQVDAIREEMEVVVQVQRHTSDCPRI
jgi:hypothetical protein